MQTILWFLPGTYHLTKSKYIYSFPSWMQLLCCNLTICSNTIGGVAGHIHSHQKAKDKSQKNVIYLMASTTTILNSSDISDMKEAICFMSRSTLLSEPVFSRVVMASVAMLLLLSVIRFSRSRLQAVTAAGCFIATLFRVLTAANLED